MEKRRAAISAIRRSKAMLLHAMKEKKAALAAAVDSDADTEDEREDSESAPAPTAAASSMADEPSNAVYSYQRADTMGDAVLVPRQQPRDLMLMGVFDGATYAHDDEWLKVHGKGLFPNGIADARPERLFLGARVTKSAWYGTDVYKVQVDMYTKVQVDPDNDNYHNRITAGDLTLQVKTGGLYLALFYGNRAYTMDDSPIWERIWRRSTVDPRKYMTSVLRAFIQTRLSEHMPVNTPLTLDAVGGHLYHNNQRALVLYYRSMGFVEVARERVNPAVTPMTTTVATFLHDTAHMARWTADFRPNGEPDDGSLVYPVVLTGANHSHI